jgi:hypothetical protein
LFFILFLECRIPRPQLEALRVKPMMRAAEPRETAAFGGLVPGLYRKWTRIPLNSLVFTVRNVKIGKIAEPLFLMRHPCHGTKDCRRQAIEAGIPTYLIDSEEARPKRLRADDPRLE